MKKSVCRIKNLFSVLALCAALQVPADPEISLEGKKRVDFGKYPAKEKKSTEYILKNTGDETLKIVRIRKTCGCAEAKADRTEIRPGESAELKAVILGDSVYGPYSQSIYVETNDPDTRFLQLTLCGNAVPLVKIKPQKTLYAGRLMPGRPWKQGFMIVAARGEKVVPGEPVLTSNYPVRAGFRKAAEGRWRLDLSLTPEKARGDLKCKVKIPILEPGGWKPADILVLGKVGRELKAVPGRIKLRKNAEKETQFRIKLRLLGSRSINPGEIVLPEIPGIGISTGKTKGNTVEAVLKVSAEYTGKAEPDEKGKVSSLKITYPGAQPADLIFLMKK